MYVKEDDRERDMHIGSRHMVEENMENMHRCEATLSSFFSCTLKSASANYALLQDSLGAFSISFGQLFTIVQ